MGAGIAAGPLSPRLDLIGCFPKKASSPFGSAAAPPTPRTAPVSHFGHRGRVRYPFGPQHRDLRRPARHSGRNPTASPWPLSPDRLPPGDGRRASMFHGHVLPYRGDGKGRFGTPILPVCRTFACATTDRPQSPVPRHCPEQFPCGTFSKLRHKQLMSPRFLASSSSAYSHDGVIESESSIASNDILKLWITWISWRRFARSFTLHCSDERKVVLCS